MYRTTDEIYYVSAIDDRDILIGILIWNIKELYCDISTVTIIENSKKQDPKIRQDAFHAFAANMLDIYHMCNRFNISIFKEKRGENQWDVVLKRFSVLSTRLCLFFSLVNRIDFATAYNHSQSLKSRRYL